MSRAITTGCKRDCQYFDHLNFRCLLPDDQVCVGAGASTTVAKLDANGNVVMDVVSMCLGDDVENLTEDYCDVCGEPIPNTIIVSGIKTHFAMCDKCKKALLAMRKKLEGTH